MSASPTTPLILANPIVVETTPFAQQVLTDLRARIRDGEQNLRQFSEQLTGSTVEGESLVEEAFALAGRYVAQLRRMDDPLSSLKELVRRRWVERTQPGTLPALLTHESGLLDQEAFGLFVAEWTPRIMKFARRRQLDHQSSEDVVQQVLSKIVSNEHYRFLDLVVWKNAWLWKLIRHTCFDMGREKKAEKDKLGLVALDDAGEIKDPKEYHVDEGLRSEESLEALAKVRDSLNSELKRTFELWHDQGLDAEEIARAEGIKVGAVNKRIRAINAKLCESLGEELKRRSHTRRRKHLDRLRSEGSQDRER
jgi:RNA polymerase sigma factor (sigma-70 family)